MLANTDTNTNLLESQLLHNAQKSIGEINFQQNNADLMHYIFDNYKERIIKIVRHMNPPNIDPEDIVQDTMVTLTKKLASQFLSKSQISTYIHKCVVNIVLMALRKKQYVCEHTTAGGDIVNKKDAISFEISNFVDSIYLSKIISRLPPGYKKILILHDIYGYEHEEIAVICNISSGTSKSQLHKARMRMKQILSEDTIIN